MGDPRASDPRASDPRASDQSADPDAAGLPPHIRLPDADVYRQTQYRSRLILSAAALIFLLVYSLLSTNYRIVSWLCTGIVAVSFFFNLWRYLAASKRMRAHPTAAVPDASATSAAPTAPDSSDPDPTDRSA